MKQTAVEWLVETLNNKIDYIPIKHWDYLREIIQQAKAMEKEQMRTASCPYVGGWEEGEFEDWYNQTFKSE